jgi:MerR family mercuric resistance operon transcriptional regulator
LHINELNYNSERVKCIGVLALSDGNCEEAWTVAEHKLEGIQQQIEDLNAKRGELTKQVKVCRKGIDGRGHFASIETLTKSDR